MPGKSTYSDDDSVLLGAAAAIVGVHPDTLRRWADAGKVPVSRTPSNQRRFRVGDLRKLIVPEQRGPARVETDAPASSTASTSQGVA